MVLHIALQGSNLKLSLHTGKRVIDELILPIDRNLDTQLITGLDKLFRRNRLDRLSLKAVEIGGNIDKNSSSYRIILAFKKGLLAT